MHHQPDSYDLSAITQNIQLDEQARGMLTFQPNSGSKSLNCTSGLGEEHSQGKIINDTATAAGQIVHRRSMSRGSWKSRDFSQDMKENRN